MDITFIVRNGIKLIWDYDGGNLNDCTAMRIDPLEPRTNHLFEPFD
jgi:hypothetical protein